MGPAAGLERALRNPISSKRRGSALLARDPDIENASIKEPRSPWLHLADQAENGGARDVANSSERF